MIGRMINHIGVPLEDEPAFLLWAADVDYKTDKCHIIWLRDMGAELCYGILTEDGDREVLAYYTGSGAPVVSDELLGLYTLRMETTLRWLWHECLFTHSPLKTYRWYRFPDELQEALEFHRHLYGKPQETKFIYGGGKATNDVDTD